jgi:hypothetical protein
LLSGSGDSSEPRRKQTHPFLANKNWHKQDAWKLSHLDDGCCAGTTRRRTGRSGLKTPVETSPRTSAAPTFLVTTDNDGETSMAWTSEQEGCAKESSKKSVGCASAAGTGEAVRRGGSDGELGGGIERTGKPSAETLTTVGVLERASATTLSETGVCLRSVVNSDTKARCRCCRADCSGVTRVMEGTRGLWSVRSVNCRPSSRNRKCRMVRNAVRSSLSNVEYLTSVEGSFFE